MEDPGNKVEEETGGEARVSQLFLARIDRAPLRSRLCVQDLLCSLSPRLEVIAKRRPAKESRWLEAHGSALQVLVEVAESRVPEGLHHLPRRTAAGRGTRPERMPPLAPQC
jgi:hypothetical protein